MKLVLNYKSIDGDYYFDIVELNTIVGELSIERYPDSYEVKAKAYTDFYIINNKKSTLQKVEELFESLDIYREKLALFDLPMLLAEDENIVNYYAVQHDLQRVPRWCGFYY